DGDSTRPSMNTDGRIMVFESTASVNGSQAGVSQLFEYFRLDRQLFPITHGAGPSTYAMLSQDGGAMSFQSRADLMNDGHDTGTEQVFIFYPFKGSVRQVTRGNAPSLHPYMGGRYDQVTFESTATDLPGGATDGGSVIYRVPVSRNDTGEVMAGLPTVIP